MRRSEPRGFTLTEVLVAIVLMMVVFAVAISFWTGGFRYFIKGEDSQTSVHEAAMLMSRLRNDLLRLSFRPSGTDQDFARHSRGSSGEESRAIAFDPGAQTVSVAKTQPSTDMVPGSTVQFRFWVPSNTAGAPVEVSWTYQPQRSAILRKEGAGSAKAYAIPRLQDFHLQMLCQATRTKDGSPATTAPLDLFAVEPRAPIPYKVVWFRVKFLVKSEDTESKIKTTKVDLESLVFPKRFNRQPQALWKSRS